MARLRPSEVVAPEGLSGLAVAPWGEILAVAANWANAASSILVYGEDGWHPWGRQVAEFRHDDRAALADVVRECMEASGDEPDEEEICCIMSDAVDIRSAEVGAMCDVLASHGDRFSGNCVEETAEDWLDYGLSANEADEWCAIGVWEPWVAATFRDAGKTPEQVVAAAERITDEDQLHTDPIYFVCNNDLDIQELLDACD